MQFLYPLSFLAIASLIIPLIIHLWNVKQGKTLKIGSIAFLGTSSRASSKSLRINDLLLLILRCLLLLLIAILLAQPYIQKTLSSKNKGGWILVEKTNFKQVFTENRKTIDSLLKIGYEIHDFNTGFLALSLKDTSITDTTKNVTNLTYTSLLKQINHLVPNGASVYLYANHRLNRLGDQLPEISYKLNWKNINQADSLNTWITDYAGKKYEAKSNLQNTSYQPIHIEDTPPLKISIFEDAGHNDKKYLVAALNAISAFSNRKLEINTNGKADIGFWLTEKAVSAEFKTSITDSGTIFQYEKGKITTEKSFLNFEGKNIAISKRIESKDKAESIWTDGFGNSVLTHEISNSFNTYRFYSRFNPKWNELVWNDVFVKAIMPIVIRDKQADNFGFKNNEGDRRVLADNQKEILQVNKADTTNKIIQNESFGKVFWILALLILITERILSFRKGKQSYVKG